MSQCLPVSSSPSSHGGLGFLQTHFLTNSAPPSPYHTPLIFLFLSLDPIYPACFCT